jgi:putative ABC transport system permease protein
MTRLPYPTLWKITAREMQRRPGRTLLTLLGIVLGVAAVVAISGTSAATHSAYREMFAAVAGRASLEVVAEGLGGFDEALVPQLRTVPGVKAAVPVVQTPAALLGPSGGASVLVLGLDPADGAAAADYEVREGRGLGGDGILLGAAFARAHGCGLGRPARLLTPRLGRAGPVIAELPVVGLLEARGAAAYNGGAVVLLPLSRAQELFGTPGQVNSVRLVLADEADAPRVEAEVRRRLPAGLTVQPPAVRGELARHSLSSTELGLGSLSVVSLVAGAFVILNSFLMNLGERRRQLALLRALGATRRQVTRLLLREAVLLGVAGTALGIGAGLVLALGVRQLMEQLLAVALPEARWTWLPFLYALVLGPGMALGAAYLPARRAGRRSPLEDLRHRRGARAEDPRRWPAYLGLMLLAAMLTAALGLRLGWFPPAVAPAVPAPTTAVGLAGCVLALPLVLAPLRRLAALLLGPLLGVEGRLAFRQLDRQPARTALTAGVLFIGVVVSIGYGQALLDNIRDIHAWCDHNVGFDFIVRGARADTTLLNVVPLPEGLREELAGLEGVRRVDKANFIVTRVRDLPVVALPCTLPESGPLPLAVQGADADEVRRRLREGEVVLGAPLARRLDVGPGDTVTLQTRRGPRPLRVAGTTSEYTVGGMVLYLDWERGKELFDTRGAHVFTVMARPGAAAALADRLKAFCEGHGLRYEANADFRALVEQAIAGVAGYFWGLLVLVFVVAALGVANTLTMNVLEQTREIGILRAVALKRGQVSKLVVCQALALGAMSLLPGVVLGIFLAYLMNLSTEAVLGQALAFHLDVGLVAGCFVAALVVAVLASLLPARRAARLQVIQALQYE